MIIINYILKVAELIFITFVIIACTSCSLDTKSHNEQKAEVDIFKLINAIKLYKKDNLYFPGGSASKRDYRIENQYLCEILSQKSIKRGPYLDIKGPLLDPWGNPYQIWFDGTGDKKVLINNEVIAETSIAIWSYGKNGIDENGDGDDVKNWGLRHEKNQ